VEDMGFDPAINRYLPEHQAVRLRTG
jgi:hypothetical protein